MVTDSETSIPGEWMIAAVAVGVTTVATSLYRAGLTIDPMAVSAWPFYACFALGIGLCVGLRNGTTRRQRLARDLAEYLSLGTLIAVAGAVASYPAAVDTKGFVDPLLARGDALLGFDWLAWYRLVAAHRVLQIGGRVAYDSIFWMPAAILIGFAWSGQRHRARALIATLALAATITLLVFRLFPAVGPLAHEWHGPVPYMPESALWQPALIPPLREHAIHVLDLGTLRGLVSFPSFHSAAAVIFMAAAWPLRRWRWPVIAVNGAMLLATPVEGTHYLVDILGGAGVAVIALGAVRALHVWMDAKAVVRGPIAGMAPVR